VAWPNRLAVEFYLKSLGTGQEPGLFFAPMTEHTSPTLEQIIAGTDSLQSKDLTLCKRVIGHLKKVHHLSPTKDFQPESDQLFGTWTLQLIAHHLALENKEIAPDKL
jgi:hypothetical protein